LKLYYDELLSNFAFNFNLRRYNVALVEYSEDMLVDGECACKDREQEEDGKVRACKEHHYDHALLHELFLRAEAGIDGQCSPRHQTRCGPSFPESNGIL
jgi:hypothetical protein